MATNGLVVMTPASISYSGTSASINADGSVSYTSMTSLSLNGVFTGDYDNYMIIGRLQGGPCNMQMKLRSGGSDTSSSSYNNDIFHSSGSTNSSGRYHSVSDMYFGDVGNTASAGYVGYLFGPYLTQPTAVRSVSTRDNSGGYISHYSNMHATSSSYDGFTTYPSSGSVTGLITVFGFNQ